MKACRNFRRSSSARPRGFTLFELMLAIAVAALVLGLGVPMFQSFVQASRITGVANEFLSAVYLSRSEAIKRRATTVLCLTSNPDDAEPACDGDGTQGWVVFVDDGDPDVIEATDRNGEVDEAAGEQVLLRHGAVHPAVVVDTAPDDNDGYVSFAPTGMMRQVPDLGDLMTTFLLCDDRGNVVVSGTDDSAARAVLISQIGRPRVTRSQSEIDDEGGCP